MTDSSKQDPLAMLAMSHRYLNLPPSMYARVSPEPVAAPTLLCWNDSLANQLHLVTPCHDSNRIASALNPQQRLDLASGRALSEAATPVALAYAGHQFGGFNPKLGDGRAHLIGQVYTKTGAPRDLQLKGSGATPFARRGDGRCGLGPALREYIMSEAVHAMGIPTMRSLAVVSTGESVYRQTKEPGGIVTRVARSHLRVGSFEFLSRHIQPGPDGRYPRDHPALAQLQALCRFAYTDCVDPSYDSSGEDSTSNVAGFPCKDLALELLDRVIDTQVTLVTHWLRVGFVHGVLNTDNTALSGESIDFGPCAMLGRYDPNACFSSIDQQGRYRFGQQTKILQWNMARFAESLLPLISSDLDEAVAAVKQKILDIDEKARIAMHVMMAAKLGLIEASSDQAPDQAPDHRWEGKIDPKIGPLISELLSLMEKERLDYTQTFVELAYTLSRGEDSLKPTGKAALSSPFSCLDGWLDTWHRVLADTHRSTTRARECMQRHNPWLIPRNQWVEAALEQTVRSVEDTSASSPDTSMLDSLLKQLQGCYNYPETKPSATESPAPELIRLDPNFDERYQTFCGT